MTSHLPALAATLAPFAGCATVPTEAAQVPERAARHQDPDRGQRLAHR